MSQHKIYPVFYTNKKVVPTDKLVLNSVFELNSPQTNTVKILSNHIKYQQLIIFIDLMTYCCSHVDLFVFSLLKDCQ
jgi:hypothetical protein